jgi:hypothetical protein
MASPHAPVDTHLQVRHGYLASASIKPVAICVQLVQLDTENAAASLLRHRVWGLQIAWGLIAIPPAHPIRTRLASAMQHVDEMGGQQARLQ